MSSKWIELESQRYMSVAKRTPVVLVRGEGCRVWDENGKAYLDMVGGWAVNTLGHSSPVIVDALTEQASQLIHTSNQFYTVPQLELADLLIQNSAFDRAFFSNSGVEANEGAVKLARKYGQHKRNGAYEVITTDHSFHGRSLAMLTATGKPAYKQDYGPLPDGFLADPVPFNDLDAVKKATTDKTCAVMVEPVQGEGGVNPATREYLQGLRDWCDQNNLLLIFDEVQTGVGRLGTLWGYELYGVEPDVMTLAKGLGGGVPIGAILCTEKANIFTYGDHGSTFGGNPLATAVALAVMRETLKEDLPGHAKKVGNYLQEKLNGLRPDRPYITDVRGHGLLVGIEFDSDIAAEALGKLLEEGVLMNAPAGNVLRFMPPLVLTEEEVDEVVGKLAKVLDEIKAKTPA
ncbi:MAG TPA: aspartate aminotransferase family protein [Chloroflexota bacterium]|nr:aspartate aminotransferase family protein [Chloroflexota bacterium]